MFDLRPLVHLFFINKKMRAVTCAEQLKELPCAAPGKINQQLFAEAEHD
jgi:hypothetical protein